MLVAPLLLALVEPWSLVEPALLLDPFDFEAFLPPEFFAVVEPSLELFPAGEEAFEDPELPADPELAELVLELPESGGLEVLDDAFGPELLDDGLLAEASGLAVEEFPLSLGGGLDVVGFEFGWLFWVDDAF